MYKFIPILIFGLTPFWVSAQEAIPPRPSPTAILSMRFQDSYFKITYSQPHKRGRLIFGNLVPFGQVWRTGANEATELLITHDIHINNQLLKAGVYSVFTIPEKNKWTIIINADIGLWGAYNYNPKRDVMRFDVPVQSLDTPYESFTIKLNQKNDQAEWEMMWDRTKISIPISFIHN